MEHSTELAVDADPAVLAEILADLSTYPSWNDLVQTADRSNDGDAELPSWNTTLRAQVGPFARSKRLNLVRTVDEAAADGEHLIRFERLEQDGREHAEWVMEAAICPAGETTLVTLRLAYSGGLYTSILDPVLGSAIERACRRLPDYVRELTGS